MTQPKVEFFFGETSLAKRYGVTPRTIQRWMKGGKLPSPTTLPSGRPAWANTVIEAHERGLVGRGEAA